MKLSITEQAFCCSVDRRQHNFGRPLSPIPQLNEFPGSALEGDLVGMPDKWGAVQNDLEQA
jgi:hypothetical protein